MNYIGKNDSEYFIIGNDTGILRLVAPLDRDPATGGVEGYKVVVTATDGETQIDASLLIKINNINDNVPKFSKTYYVINNPSQDVGGGPLLSFDVTDDDITSNITVTIISNVTGFLLHRAESGIWRLELKQVGQSSDFSFPNRIRLLASDGGIPEMTSRADVIFIFSQCEKKEATTQTTERTSAPMTTVVTKATSTRTHIASTSEPTTEEETTVTALPTAILVEQKTLSPSKECGVMLWQAICIVEGAAIVVAILIFLLKKCGCIKKSSVDVSPHRAAPLGCETGMNYKREAARKERSSRSRSQSATSRLSTKGSDVTADHNRTVSRGTDKERELGDVAETRHQPELGKDANAGSKEQGFDQLVISHPDEIKEQSGRNEQGGRKTSKQQNVSSENSAIPAEADAVEELNKDLMNIIEEGRGVPPMDTKASYIPKHENAETEDPEKNELAYCKDNAKRNNRSHSVLNVVQEARAQQLSGHRNPAESKTTGAEVDGGKQEPPKPRQAEKTDHKDGGSKDVDKPKIKKARTGKFKETKEPGGAAPAGREQDSRTNSGQTGQDGRKLEEERKHDQKGKDTTAEQNDRTKSTNPPIQKSAQDDIEKQSSKKGTEDVAPKTSLASPMGFFDLVMIAKKAKEEELAAVRDTKSKDVVNELDVPGLDVKRKQHSNPSTPRKKKDKIHDC
ncbi:protein IWS1 homolog A-like [Gigantopelta aegis]|uniref:protein IWS1 homolog A-like n=1 Tax=Gigantopelta aegis TaxID=1735272 RepID=UPI001B88B4FC|nr:protein IWS1 homolog A-like [Gigantopelta aegis]